MSLPQDPPVLILAPIGSDASAIASLLQAQQISAHPCHDAAECAGRITPEAGALVITEEVLELTGVSKLLEALKAQPAWSELPLIILTRGGEQRVSSLLDLAASAAGPATLLERPMSAATLLRSVQVALRSRRRQYQVRDLLSEQQRQQEALGASERRYRLLFDRNPDGVFTVDGTGRFALVNAACEKITGYTSAEILEKTFLDLCAPDQLAQTVDQFQKGLTHPRHMEFETALIRKDGTRVEVWIAGESIVSENGAVATHGTAKDISERKRAEERLHAAHQRLQYHMENTPLAVIEFDTELRICAWNSGAQRVFGWEAAEVLGRPLWDIPWVCEEDQDKVATVSKALSVGRTMRSVSLNRNRRKDGTVIWCEWYNSSLTDSGGRLQSIQSLVLDVSKREAFQHELERLVAERTVRLQELVAELEHFSYTITHDMRAPLRAMQGFAELHAEACETGDFKDAKRFLQRIRTSANRMDALITDALNYNKAVRQELPLEPVDAAALLRGMVDTYPELQVARADIQIAGEFPLILANKAGLTQCFSNLLGNAIKFTKPGQKPAIRIWAEARPGPAVLPVQNSLPARPPIANPHPAAAAVVRISIEDQGVGIPDSMLPRVFDMFSRGQNTHPGTGIGLALVRKVMDRMGGRAGVESQEGRGSRFWLEFSQA